MHPIQTLCPTGLFESLSYLFLLGIVTSLKYLAQQPLALQIGGWFCGLFFIFFFSPSCGLNLPINGSLSSWA